MQMQVFQRDHELAKERETGLLQSINVLQIQLSEAKQGKK